MSAGTEYTEVFFCDEPGGQLHKASTTDIDTHVRECATKLNDSGPLAKLAMSEMMFNPFLEYSKELVLDTKIIMHDKAVQSVMSAKQLGIEQYHAFVADRIISNNNAAITDTLSKNSLPLFHSHVQNENSKSHSKAITLKRDCHLFSRLYIACQSREADLEQFFMHENQSEPPSISSQGRI